MKIVLKVNGEMRELDIEVNELLSDVLRNRLGLTSVKKGCSSGDCGACTVLLDGRPILSCLTLAVEADGREVMTLEGLEKDGELHPLQRAFLEEAAAQCGYCASAMILTSLALLRENPSPSEEDVKRAIEGNLCRCGTYQNVIKAVLKVSGKT